MPAPAQAQKNGRNRGRLFLTNKVSVLSNDC
jgi:hypothetical protein